MNPLTPQIMVAEILATDLTQTQLAGIVPCSQAAISSLLTGSRGGRISKWLGDRLEEIHLERCPKKLSRKPRRPKPPTKPAGPP